jgi:hypothetical protein
MKMKKTTLSAAMAVALGGVSANALADLTTTAVLQFNPGLCADGSIATQNTNCYYSAPVSSGSFFAMDGNGDGQLKAKEFVGITMNNGITIGVVQGASGSHGGPPNGTESPNIDLPWNFFGNTGMHQTTSPITVLTDNGATKTLDFSGWDVTWNGLASIPMGGDTANFPADTGIATITCSTASCSASSTFVLDYQAHVPSGDPSNFGGVLYGLHLEGHVAGAAAVIPVPAAAWLFGSGLVGLVGIARRRRSRET